MVESSFWPWSWTANLVPGRASLCVHPLKCSTLLNVVVAPKRKTTSLPPALCPVTQAAKVDRTAHIILATSDYSFLSWISEGAYMECVGQGSCKFMLFVRCHVAEVVLSMCLMTPCINVFMGRNIPPHLAQSVDC